MAIADTIRAWKDAEYRFSLSDQQRSLLPPHPAGDIEQEVLVHSMLAGYLEDYPTAWSAAVICDPTLSFRMM